MEELFNLPVPFGEKVARGRPERWGKHGIPSNVDSVEILQPGTAPVQSSQVDDAKAGSVNPSIGHLAALVGTTFLPGSLRSGHLQGDLGQVLHGEDQTKDG